MKKLLFLGIILFTGCSKEGSHPLPDLYGTWGSSVVIGPDGTFNDFSRNYLLVTRFIFRKDNSFESSTFLVEEDSFEVIGYRERMDGIFSKQGNRISLNYDQYSSGNPEDDFPILPKDELNIVGENINRAFNFSILDNNSILKFDFDPCGPLQYCVGGMTLVRVK